MRYRKKPVEVEAMQFREDDCISLVNWMKGSSGTLTFEAGRPPYVEIYTLEGVMTARPGDWIIKGVKGEFYPCRDDIFRETYEVAE